jgi:3-oxoacyl-[acyl-carrier-protein] synthase III
LASAGELLEGAALGARLSGFAVHLPERQLSTAAVERRIEAASEDFAPPPGLIGRLTGIRYRHVMPDDWQASDLAVAAARKLIANSGVSREDVGLLIFASASQDMVEPATGHMVSAKLGLGCPVMDVKNACNSVLNGLEVADALVSTGRYRTALVVTGESPSRAVRWRVAGLRQFLSALPGYTLSDAGAALLVTAGEPGANRPRILDFGFTARSSEWPVGMLPAGGSMRPRDPDATYFHLDGVRLKDAFLSLGSDVLDATLARLGLTWADFAMVGLHQVSLPYLEILRSRLSIPADKLVVTIAAHGNVASASLPLQLERAWQAGRCGPGDLVALVGLAGGISLGIMVVRL